jgi:dipeptidyl aminopeptidase/acylaminoacyl peptidase
VAGDIALPAWVFGQSRYALLSDGRVLCAYSADGVDRLGLISADGLTFSAVDAPFTTVASVHAFGDGAAVLGASPVLEPAVAALDLSVGASTGATATALLRPPRDLGLDPSTYSVPRTLTFPTTDGESAHALYYPPVHPGIEGPVGERPPLVVISHGGPTSAARAQLSLAVQFWTSRGFAVVDVNYRGSSGFGRRYRQALDGRWGIADVDDCIAAARHLAGLGYVDGERLVIRGASAGGFTTLCALTFHDVFTVGVSLYGVADLEALAADTHKFEARYLDALVGPWPEARDVYRARSPIDHTDGLSCPLLLLQGLEDAIVPPAQAELLVEALRAKGLPFAYVAF